MSGTPRCSRCRRATIGDSRSNRRDPIAILLPRQWKRRTLRQIILAAANPGDAAMTIETILRQKGTDVATIAPEASIKSAADWLHARNIGALVVTSGNAMLGLVSEREIVHAFSRYGEAAASMPVKEIMRYGVITVSPEDSVNQVMNLMTRHRVRHMPVLRDGKLAGIISIGDVVKHRLDDLELETKVLRDAYIAAH
jgi:CBS domain-containing protein